jgi:hypothetical protein
MKKRKRFLFAVGCLLVLASIWPTLELVNRVRPFILGFPFFVFYMVALNFLVSLFLLIAYETLD